MAKEYIEISDKLQDKINQEATEEQIKEIYSGFHKYNLVNYLFSYIIDSKFRIAVKLHKWIKKQIGNPIIEQVAAECMTFTKNKLDYDKTMINILRYWYNKIVYKTDINNFGKFEYWANVEEILEKSEDDCEGFSTLIYLTALACGISEYRFYFTIGWVNINNQKVGHAYVTYIADDLVMYAIDGTFYPIESMKFTTPYFINERYYFGSEEWARFNTQGTYKIK
ncbi:MAG: hypothetical protein ACOC3Z_00610 [Nanoarchaeota archaeon]